MLITNTDCINSHLKLHLVPTCLIYKKKKKIEMWRILKEKSLNWMKDTKLCTTNGTWIESDKRLKTGRPWKVKLFFFMLFFILYLFSPFLTLSPLGLYAGIKFFVIDFLFKSCPKLRDKYDTPHIVWNSLPTDPQLKERTNATVSRRVREQKHIHIHNCFLPPLADSCFCNYSMICA